MIIKCVVGCLNINDGDPDFFFCKVKCTEAEFEVGLHRQIAEEAARKQGHEGPFLVYLEGNSCDWLFERFVWESASIFATKEVQAKEQLSAHVAALIDAIESVQDWKGTHVGDMIEAVQSVLNLRY